MEPSKIEQPTAVAELRRATLLAVLALIEEHQLPYPSSIQFSPAEFRDGTDYLHLHLDRNDPAGVARWAAVLGLTAIPTRHFSATVGHDAFDAVKASGTWHGWGSVEAVSYCDVAGDAA